MAFRIVDGSNYYVFLVRDDGFFSFGYYENGAFTRVVDWTAAEALRPGQVNTLAVLGEGSRFTFFINHTAAAETEDARFTQGIAGLVMSVNDAPETYRFDFDNFELRAP